MYKVEVFEDGLQVCFEEYDTLYVAKCVGRVMTQILCVSHNTGYEEYENGFRVDVQGVNYGFTGIRIVEVETE